MPDGGRSSRRTVDSRIFTIIDRNRAVEMWHIYCEGKDHRERDIELPKETRTRMVKARRQRCDVYRHQLARQEWGHFPIRRYHATRIQPWASRVGLAMLIPGTLLAAGSCNRLVTQVPLGVLMLAFSLITLGGLLTIVSGLRIFTRSSFSGDSIPLESLGVLSRALGFTSDVIAIESLPGGCRPDHFKGLIEIEAPVGEWEILEEYSIDAGWYRAS